MRLTQSALCGVFNLALYDSHALRRAVDAEHRNDKPLTVDR